MRTIAVVNQKGGCGKTTTAINLAGVFASLGQRTLLVDLDPQSHCAAGLAIPEDRIDLHIGDAMLLADDAPIDLSRLLWRVSRNLDLAPSHVKLAGLEAARGGLASLPDRDQRLETAIRRIATANGAHKYEWCVIDCPPTIGLLTFNAVRAATEVIVPVETGFFALKGAGRQIATLRTLARRLGTTTPHRVLATMHDAESPLARSVLAEIGREFADRLTPVVIRYDAKLKEAAALGQPIVEYAATAPGAEDYGRLAAWLVDNPPARIASVRTAPVPHPVEDLDHAPTPDAVTGPAEASAATTAPAGDPVLTRAAELASRVRQLVHKSQTLQSRLASDPVVATAAERFGGVGNTATIIESRSASVPAPQPTPLGVRFSCLAPSTSRVFVAGDFNGWSATATPLRYDPASGLHHGTVPIPPGMTQYRLVIDDVWIADPHNPHAVENPFGERNSVVVVRPAQPVSVAAERVCT